MSLKERIAKAKGLSEQPKFSVDKASKSELYINGAIDQARDCWEIIKELEAIIEEQQEGLTNIKEHYERVRDEEGVGYNLYCKARDALSQANKLLNGEKDGK